MCGIIALLPLSESDVFGIRHSSFSSRLVLIIIGSPLSILCSQLLSIGNNYSALAVRALRRQGVLRMTIERYGWGRKIWQGEIISR